MTTRQRAQRRAMTGLAWLSAAALTGMIGCSSDGERDRQRASDRPSGGAVRQADWETGRAQTVALSESAGTAAGFSTTSSTIDGVLRIAKRVPREVRAGNAFEYDITVENVSDLMLTDVWIREHDANAMPSMGEQMEMQQRQQQRPMWRSEAPGGQVGMTQPGMNQPGMQRQPTQRPAGGTGMDAESRPVSQPMDQRAQGAVTAPIRGQGEPMVVEEPAIRPAGQRLDQPMDRPIDRPMGQGMDRPMDREMNQQGPMIMDTAAPQQPGMAHEGGEYQEVFIGSLAPGDTRTVTVTGTVEQAGQFMICTSAAYTPMVCTLGTAIQPELSLRKVGPEFAMVGENIVYELTVLNSGIGAARDVRIIDPLPGNMRTAQGQPEATFNAGTLEAGQSRTFTVTASAPVPGRYTNIARAVAAGGLEGEAQAVTVIRAPQLQVEKIGPSEDYTNVGVTFEIAVTNVGDAPATNVVLEDIIPQGARFIEGSEGARATDGRVTWDLGTIAPEETRTVLVQMAGNQVGTFENCVTARADRLEPVRDCWTVRLEGVTGLLLELVDTNDPIRVGGQEVYVIRVTNQGTAEATDVGLDVQLDERMQLVSADGATQFGRTADGLTFSSLPSLPPGQSAVWRVVTEGAGTGDTRFRVALRAAELERPVIAGESTRVFE